MIGTPNTVTCHSCDGAGVQDALDFKIITCSTCRGFGFCIDSEFTIGFTKQFIAAPEWQSKEIERLHRKSTEARHVLEDFVNDQRPNDTWVLKLVGRLSAIYRLVISITPNEYRACQVCGSWNGCLRSCPRLALMDLTPALLDLWIEDDHFVALNENARRKPVEFSVHEIPPRPCDHRWLTNRVVFDSDGKVQTAGVVCATCFEQVSTLSEQNPDPSTSDSLNARSPAERKDIDG